MRILTAVLASAFLPACLLATDCPSGGECFVDFPEGTGGGGGGGGGGGNPDPYLSCEQPWGADRAGIADGGAMSCASPGAVGAELTDGTPFVLDWRGDDLTVRATGTGSTTLTTEWTGFDPIELPLEARPAASLELRHPWMYRFLEADGPTAHLAGERVEVVVALEDFAGGRLVDTDLALTIDGAPPASRWVWDAYDLGALPVGDHTLAITAGAAAGGTVVFPVVDTVDELAVAEVEEAPLPAHPGEHGGVCFHAFNAGRELAVGWTYEITGPARASSVEAFDADNCVWVEATGVGHVEVRATREGDTGAPAVAAFDVTAAAG